MSNVVVKFIGNGLYKDSNGELWDRTDKNGKSTRDYDGPVDAFNEARPDLKFMIDYGQMQMHVVENTEEPTCDTKAKDTEKVEPKVEIVEPKTEIIEPKTEIIEPKTEHKDTVKPAVTVSAKPTVK